MSQRSVPRRGRWGVVSLFALLALCAAACSSRPAKLNPVTGKVLHNNQPLPNALITFHPKVADIKAIPPTARTEADGTFKVMTGDKEGAPEGDYVITIICSELPESAKKGGLATAGVDTVDRLKGAYANRDASKIEVKVRAGPNQLEPWALK